MRVEKSIAELREKIEAYLNERKDPSVIDSTVIILVDFLKSLFLPTTDKDLTLMPNQITFDDWLKNKKAVESTTMVSNESFEAFMKSKEYPNYFDNKFFLTNPAAKVFEGFIFIKFRSSSLFDITRPALEKKLSEINVNKIPARSSAISPSRTRSFSIESESKNSSESVHPPLPFLAEIRNIKLTDSGKPVVPPRPRTRPNFMKELNVALARQQSKQQLNIEAEEEEKQMPAKTLTQ